MSTENKPIVPLFTPLDPATFYPDEMPVFRPSSEYRPGSLDAILSEPLDGSKVMLIVDSIPSKPGDADMFNTIKNVNITQPAEKFQWDWEPEPTSEETGDHKPLFGKTPRNTPIKPYERLAKKKQKGSNPRK